MRPYHSLHTQNNHLKSFPAIRRIVNCRSMTKDFSVRVIYPDGSSLLHSVALDQTVRAALRYFLKKRQLPKGYDALKTEDVEWVLFVPSTGQVLRAHSVGPVQSRLLSGTPYVQVIVSAEEPSVCSPGNIASNSVGFE